MSRNQIKIPLILIIGLSFILMMVVGGCSSQSSKPHELQYSIQDFSFQDMNQREVSLTSLKGKVWISNFYFSHCTTVCPVEMPHLAKLQQMLKDADIPVQIVSFTVDPENDTPEVLQQFAAKYHADTSNWHFVTGYSFDTIKQLSEQSFHSAVVRPAPDSDQYTHGTRFYLVDQNGIAVATYKGFADPPYDQIVKDVKALQSK